MNKKASIQPFLLMSFLSLIFIFVFAQASFAELSLNDNVNVGGDIFLEGDGCGITFSDGSCQTTGAITPWSQKISEGRFVLVLDDEAVLDRETGLVWQRATINTEYDWNSAQTYCYRAYIGGRFGWRLPTIEELTTLFDPSVPQMLPEGHLFIDTKSSIYWSSTTFAGDTTRAWVVDFYVPGYIGNSSKSSFSCYVRAVRSGQ